MQARLVSTIVIALMGAGASACATAPKPNPVNESGSFAASFDEVWNSAVESLSELDLPVEKTEKGSGVLSTNWISFKGTGNQDYCDCGNLGPNQERAREGRIRVHLDAHPDDGGVDLHIDTLYRQVRVNGNAVATKACTSTGALEAKIRNEVVAHL